MGFKEKDVDIQTGLPPSHSPVGDEESVYVASTTDLHRRLNNRQTQLIAIGGSIGTAIFVSIGGALTKGGPGSLLVSWLLYSCIIAMVNNCMAEMATYMPVGASFIRHAGHWVDDAFGFMAGWNFFFYEAILIPFEIVALNLVLTFWRDDIPVAAVCCACIVSYGLLNVLAVRVYGEAEFWLSGGKVLLVAIVFSFTLVTMCGGNPAGDAYGFRNWNSPEPFLEYLSTGTLGRFEGFLAALWQGAFTIVGPEYIAMVAGEVRNPRPVLKQAFKTVYIRFALFFIGSAIFVGIAVSPRDPTLNRILNSGEGAGTGAASPYVIAMQNLGVDGLPHLVNALLITSIFSAGNTYVYCASRTLHGLASDGHAHHLLRKTTKSGVPIYCFAITMIFPFISLLQVSSGSAVVITWLVNLVTAGGLINFIVMSITYIFFYRACMAQGLDRRTLPYRGWFQPYSAYIACSALTLVVFCYGYSVFRKGGWDVGTFFTYYTMLILAPITFSGWKLYKKTKLIKAAECDLIWDLPAIQAHEEECVNDPPLFSIRKSFRKNILRRH
ncbi:hypothetical protein VTL71DRAFT_13306 [Oculimacula yallundae]|uniref:Amino acid permease/ SLC12A domain-containing protein n=1 Tax=Oculimacula yallundae TaxID=86028 RepID=A0ABR4CJZ6_9HELO